MSSFAWRPSEVESKGLILRSLLRGAGRVFELKLSPELALGSIPFIIRPQNTPSLVCVAQAVGGIIHFSVADLRYKHPHARYRCMWRQQFGHSGLFFRCKVEPWKLKSRGWHSE